MSAHRLKRLRYRAWHRGTKELDLVLGRFADGHLAAMNEAELNDFERLIDADDPDLQAWVLKNAEPAERDRSMVARLRASLETLAGDQS